ncbi:PIF-0 [Crangon crangon nudivirus]|uniref:PIF-0 n=1 Tax=Crangon crangon nudivirus TaxID=2880838 RepID=A0AAE9BYQ2_9VIRU|nr:PIF-0 [Crangon crangon nudivirus]UBZ25559.1 PIF-0 [Crangon crangon nudivirus]
MSYTNQDLRNAMTYTNHRLMLRNINTMYEKHPHLTSHLEYTISQADADTDYYYPIVFKKKAIVVKTHINEKLCDKVSCNSTKAMDTCISSDVAGYYHVGDDSTHYGRHCQPACYHLLDNPVIDEETGNEQTQMSPVEYSKRHGCIFLPPTTWHEFPFYRSEEKFEQRTNDIPIGFNRAPDLDYTYSGRNYTYNAPYCEAFYDGYDGGDKCTKKWWETVLYAVVGESIIKLCKAGVQNIKNGNGSSYKPLHLAPLPPIEDEWLLANWIKDIDTSFVVPAIDYILPDKPQQQRTLPQTPFQRRTELFNRIQKRRKHIPSNVRRKIEMGEVLSTEDEEAIARIRSNTARDGKGNTWTHDYIKVGLDGAFIRAIQDILASKEFWRDMGLGIFMEQKVLGGIEKLCKKLADKIIPKLALILEKAAGKLVSIVFEKAMVATLANVAAKIMIKTAGKLLTALAKMAAEAASIIGTVLMVLAFWDLILSFWDPLGFNNKYDIRIISDIMKNSDTAMRVALGTPIPVMTFDILIGMTLTEDEIIDNGMLCFYDTYEYLDSLTVNSEGSRIYKGVELLGLPPTVEDTNDALAKNALYTSTDFHRFELSHTQRMNYYKLSNNVAVGLAVLSGLFLVMGIYFMATLCITLCLMVSFISYLNAVNVNVPKYIESLLDTVQ